MVEKDPSTLFFQAPRVVLFVALGEAFAVECEKGCDPIRVMKVPAPAEAARLIVELHPILVLMGESLSAEEEDNIHQHAAATGAVLVRQREVDASEPEGWMRESVRAALRLRTIRSM